MMAGSPVVEDLAAHDVSPNAPAVLVALLAEPVVAEQLGVEVVRLVRRMVHVRLRPLEEEEAVVVHELLAPVEVEEGCDILAARIVYQLTRLSTISPIIKHNEGERHKRGT